MADNIPITAGTGTTVATDDVSTVHYQYVKLADGTADSSAVIPGDATNGLDVDVTRLPALAAGTNNIGDVDIFSIAAGDNNIGNVDIVTMPAVTNAGTFAVQVDGNALTALQLIDDPVFVFGTATYLEATSKGMAICAVRRDADTTLVDTTNEFAPLIVDANGYLKVEIFDGGGSHTVDGTVSIGSIAAGDNNIGNIDIASIAAGDNNIGNVDIITMPSVTNAGTFAVQVDGSALTALQLIDDPILVLGTATYAETTTKGMVIGVVRRDADTSAVGTDNEVAPLLVNAIGALKVEIFDGGDSHTVDGTVTANLAAGTNNIGDIDILTIAAGDNNIGNVDIVTMPNVTNAGTFAVQIDGSALTALQLIDDPVFADDAGFTIGTSKVMVGGGVAVAHGSNPDVADANDAVALLTNRHRIPFTLGGHPNIVSAEYFTSGAITDDNILPAIAAGTIYVITSITVACSNANATSPSVRIGFGTASVPAQGATNADAVSKVVLSHPGIPPGGGMVKGNGQGIVGIGGDGEELRITCTTPTTSLIVQVDYFTISS